jgi:hypothetical protein
MSKSPLRFKDLLKALKPYGVKVKQGGKGSETILVRPLSENSPKGPQYTIKNTGPTRRYLGVSSKLYFKTLAFLKRLFGVIEFCPSWCKYDHS